jgi:hypothetical protein
MTTTAAATEQALFLHTTKLSDVAIIQGLPAGRPAFFHLKEEWQLYLNKHKSSLTSVQLLALCRQIQRERPEIVSVPEMRNAYDALRTLLMTIEHQLKVSRPLPSAAPEGNKKDPTKVAEKAKTPADADSRKAVPFLPTAPVLRAKIKNLYRTIESGEAIVWEWSLKSKSSEAETEAGVENKTLHELLQLAKPFVEDPVSDAVNEFLEMCLARAEYNEAIFLFLRDEEIPISEKILFFKMKKREFSSNPQFILEFMPSFQQRHLGVAGFYYDLGDCTHRYISEPYFFDYLYNRIEKTYKIEKKSTGRVQSANRRLGGKAPVLPAQPDDNPEYLHQEKMLELLKALLSPSYNAYREFFIPSSVLSKEEIRSNFVNLSKKMRKFYTDLMAELQKLFDLSAKLPASYTEENLARRTYIVEEMRPCFLGLKSIDDYIEKEALIEAELKLREIFSILHFLQGQIVQLLDEVRKKLVKPKVFKKSNVSSTADAVSTSPTGAAQPATTSHGVALAPTSGVGVNSAAKDKLTTTSVESRHTVTHDKLTATSLVSGRAIANEKVDVREARAGAEVTKTTTTSSTQKAVKRVINLTPTQSASKIGDEQTKLENFEKTQLNALYSNLIKPQKETLRKLLQQRSANDACEVTLQELESLFKGTKIPGSSPPQYIGGLGGEMPGMKGSHYRVKLPDTFKEWKISKVKNILAYVDIPNVGDGNWKPHGKSHTEKCLPDVSIYLAKRALTKAGITEERLLAAGIRIGFERPSGKAKA